IFKGIPFNEIKIGAPGDVTNYKWGIKSTKWNGQKTSYPLAKWHELLDQLKSQGFNIVQTEWHQIKFDADAPGTPHSWFNFEIDVERPDTQTRYLCTGQVEIEWSAEKDKQDHFLMKNLDLVDFKVLERTGLPAFKQGFTISGKSIGHKEGP